MKEGSTNSKLKVWDVIKGVRCGVMKWVVRVESRKEIKENKPGKRERDMG